MSERIRTYKWEDPTTSVVKLKEMTGLEYLKSVLIGDLPLPPFLNTMDMVPVLVEKGTVIFEFAPREFHYTQMGCVHGGMVSTVLDTVMACALHSTLEKGIGFATLEFKVNFLRPVRQQRGKMQAEGKIIQLGSTIALMEAKLIDKKGRLYAHGTSTFLIRK
ncbi:PaaI family thioesterase [Sphingobacterium sp. LRF_L2]|uniref:PaaI family thioesterase n=1 Tax=Sphingobacterium sp. LRF_L2 TaxID=3369421 RepID=UPI003F5D7BB6